MSSKSPSKGSLQDKKSAKHKKKKRGSVDHDEIVEEPPPEPPVEEEIDVYKDLRYTPAPPTEPEILLFPVDEVRVKRPRTHPVVRRSDSPTEPVCNFFLPLAEEEDIEVYNVETSMLKRRCKAIEEDVSSHKCERFFHGTAFFKLSEFFGPEDDGMRVSLKWSERQLYMPPTSIVRPDLGEEPKYRDIRGKPPQTTAEEESLQKLYIRGEACKPEPDYDSHESDELDELPISEDFKEFSMPLDTSTQSLRSLSRFESYPCGPRLDSPYFVRNVVPAFKLDRFTFVWGQICFHGIVEIGIVCNAGERGWTQILLANPGCCAMRYSWRRARRSDHFTTGRYRTSPFIFDFSEGIILPEQKVSISVQFYSELPGCWTEWWYVKTTPALGRKKNGEIPVNLWGQALEVDANFHNRARLLRDLEISSVQRMSERDVWDLIKFLPIRSRHAIMRDIISPIPDSRHQDDIAVFLKNNPGLYYHSFPMTSLLTAYALLDKELKRSPGLAEVAGGEEEKKDPRRSSHKESTSSFGQHLGSAKSLKIRSPSPSARSSGTMSKSMRLPPGGKAKSSRVLNYAPEHHWLHASVEAHKQPRAELDTRKMCREAYHKVSEDRENKEVILQLVNMSMLSMSNPFFAPPMRQYKRLMMRQALCQLFDDIARAEWKLRYDLDLLEDLRFEKLASFGSERSKTPSSASTGRVRSAGSSRIRSAGSERIRSAGTERPKSSTIVLSQGASRPNSGSSGGSVGKKSSSRFKVGSRSKTAVEGSGEEEPVTPIDWTAPAPRRWKEQLRFKIYYHLESMLESLQPVINHDGLWLNLLKPKPEAL